MDSDSSAYTAWKSWQSAPFGLCSRVQRTYFHSELLRTSLDLHSHISALEIGFGNGSFMAFAKSKGWNIVGLEIIDALILQAQQHNYSAFKSSQISSLPIESYHLVVAFDVFEHLCESDLDVLFAEIKRLLCSGGCLISRFPNGDSPFGLEGQNGDPTHSSAIGVGKVRYYAKKYDFEILFLGGEARPLLAGSISLTIRRLITMPLMWFLDVFVSTIFLPGSGICFSSRNTTAILKKLA